MIAALLQAYALLPKNMKSLMATIILLCIGYQESMGVYRRQLGNGPARGLWQFERIGVRDVMTRATSEKHARALCKALRVEFDELTIYNTLEFNDVLAAGFARLALWNDPKPLPEVPAEAFALYLRTWRPGAYTNGDEVAKKRLREKWLTNWPRAKAEAHGS